MTTTAWKRFTTRRTLLIGGSAIVAGGAAAFILGSGAPADATEMTVVKSPSCGCCSAWVTYLERAGWTITVENRADVTPAKRQAGVPMELAGCHTAFVGGYVVEGHVPLPAIEKLLAERPDLSGIAVPGMPSDAPGMGGGGVQDVLGFKEGAATGLYTRSRG